MPPHAEETSRDSSKGMETRNATITALAFAGDIILAGEGNNLKVLQAGQGAPICLLELPLFQAQAVHGLICLSFRDLYIVVAWGGRQLRTLLIQVRLGENSTSSVRVLASRCITTSDWILACRGGQIDASRTETTARNVALVTAHNALLGLHIKIEQDESNYGIHLDLTSLSAGSRVLLYAASLRWVSAFHIVIMAGSALGDIIVWSCHLEHEPETHELRSQKLSTHYAFSSHDGSVFGLDSTVVQTETARDQLLLASCSDDRTIRIWDVSAALVGLHHEVSEVCHQATDNSARSMPEMVRDAPCLLKAWAHSSRIWQVSFIDVNNVTATAEKQLVSFGEDATCQLWSLMISKAKRDSCAWQLKHKDTFLNHAGKNIWSQATSVDDELIRVVTGGADGGVVLVNIPKDERIVQPDTVQSWHSNDFAELVHDVGQQSLTKKTAMTAPKAYSFVSEDEIMMTTPAGHVLIGRRSRSSAVEHDSETFDAPTLSWNYVTTIASLQSYSVTAGLPSHKIGFIGGATGDVYAYLHGKLNEKSIVQVENKVAGLYIQDIAGQSSASRLGIDNASCKSANIVLLVARLGAPKANLHFFAFSESDEGMDLVESAPPNELDLPYDFIVTSMLYHHATSQVMLFLGGRNGKVACYQLQDKPTLLSYEQHHTDAVTCMKWLAQKTTSDDSATQGHLLTSGRDSSYALHQYHTDDDHLDVEIVHRAVLPFGPNIEGFYQADDNAHLIFYGFHSKDFVVYDETEHTEVMRIECGGAHRVWAYQPAQPQDPASSATFLWTRASALCMSSGTQTQRQWIKKGGHGREIKAVAVNPHQHILGGRECTIIATGAEDTDIRLFSLHTSSNSETQDLNCISIISKHNTGLQQLKWSSDGRYLFSAGGCEELFIWRVREVPFVQIGIVCESALPLASELPDLRIMAFDVLEVHDAELAEATSFIITIVLSDSTLRVYSYSRTSEGSSWQLRRDGRYTTCCLTQVLHLPSLLRQITQVPSRLPLLTAGTDGRISFWNIDLNGNSTQSSNSNLTVAPARPDHTITIHQNAITTAQLIPLRAALAPSHDDKESTAAASDHLLITGGDDNALAFTRFSFPSSSSDSSSPTSSPPAPAPAPATLLIPRAHAAAVRSIAVTSVRQIGHNSIAVDIMTSSNDQRLRTWHVMLDLAQSGVEGLQVRRGRKWWSCVADVAGIDVLRKRVGDREGKKAENVVESDETEEGEVCGVVVCGVGMDVVDVSE